LKTKKEKIWNWIKDNKFDLLMGLFIILSLFLLSWALNKLLDPKMIGQFIKEVNQYSK
jgi:hypothetical protein